ncbi:hypothetical protein LXL04_016725 [Taraxacum kok-saghyz]
MIPSHRGSLDNSKSDLTGEVRETYLVILVLIAAAAYQTAFSPPGGYWQEDKIASLESNCACEYASPPAAVILVRLTIEFPLVGVMQSLLVLISANYTTCVVMVLPPDYTYLRYICIGMPILYLLPTTILLFKRRSLLKYKFEF